MEKNLLVLFSIFLVFCEGLFSGTEIAFLSLKPHLVGEKYRKFLNNLEELIFTTIIGTNLSVVVNATILSYIIKVHYGFSSETLVTLILSPIVLLFGETIPKTIAKKNPVKFLNFSLEPFKIFYFLSLPIRRIVLFVPKKLGMKAVKKMPISREEIPLIIEDEEKQEIVGKIVNLRKRRVKNSMKPISDIFAVAKNNTVAEVIKLAEKTGYSRFPVYSGYVYNIEGIVWVFDLINAKKNDIISTFIRSCPFISELQSIHSAIKTFKLAKSPLAIVVNEYGLATGVLTIEDIFEELVGEIEDEYDLYTGKTEIVEKNGKKMVIHGDTSIHTLERELNTTIPHSELYRTISGFIVYHFDKIPRENEILQFHHLIFKPLKVSKGKIHLVEVTLKDDH
ncbi:MAG: hemolysin family protein [Thermosulfidibacteraceae bacterium]|mgnify:CR=1 FL=1|jgi:CBS domain containing-hemolysin-like protein